MIQQTAQQLQKTIEQVLEVYSKKSRVELVEIMHQCEEAQTHEDWTVRASAMINHCAAVTILEEKVTSK